MKAQDEAASGGKEYSRYKVWETSSLAQCSVSKIPMLTVISKLRRPRRSRVGIRQLFPNDQCLHSQFPLLKTPFLNLQRQSSYGFSVYLINTMPRFGGHRRVQDSPFEASLFGFAISLELGLCLGGDTGGPLPSGSAIFSLHPLGMRFFDIMPPT